MGRRGGRRGDRGAGRDKNWRSGRNSWQDGHELDEAPTQGRSRKRRGRERDRDRGMANGNGGAPASWLHARDDRDDGFLLSAGFGAVGPSALLPRATGPTCGGCRNWLAHEDPGGRGTCDHPGSGFAFPFTDTPGCSFFQSRRS